MNKIHLHVEKDLAEPIRLDVYLSTGLSEPRFSRTRVQKLIADGHVLLDGKPAKAGIKLKGGETLEIIYQEDAPPVVSAEEIQLAVVFEDDHLLVVNKPTGMVVHPGAGVDSGTLVNALLHHCRDKLPSIGGYSRPGIVHRLDKDTSGLLVVAKNDHAHLSLSAQIKARSATRIYQALVEGSPKVDRGVIDKAIGRHPVERKRMAVVAGGRSAQTTYEVVSRLGRFTLVRCRLGSGRTHQIRVHMASLNLPVVGDIVYNRKSTGTLAARHKLGLSGQALHAAYLSFRHPTRGELLEFEAPLPGDFQALLERLSCHAD